MIPTSALTLLPPSRLQPRMTTNWPLANPMDSLTTFHRSRGTYSAKYIYNSIIIRTQIDHCYLVTTIHPSPMILIPGTEAHTRGGVTITSPTLVANSKRGSAVMGMVPSGWVNIISYEGFRALTSSHMNDDEIFYVSSYYFSSVLISHLLTSIRCFICFRLSKGLRSAQDQKNSSRTKGERPKQSRLYCILYWFEW